MAIIIKRLNDEDIEVRCETLIDETFWKNIKEQLREAQITIDNLKNNINILEQELSYLRLKDKESK